MKTTLQNMLTALNALINEKGATSYKELFTKCKASVSSLHIDNNEDEDMLMPLFKTALLPDVYQLAYLESTGVWSNDQLNAIIYSVTDTIYNYAKKGTFNDVPFDIKRTVYQEIFGWDISFLGFPKR
jgi:hypothetical protein